VVATPAGENPGWSGEAFANFRVARAFDSSNAKISLDFDHATYTGAEIEPAVTVTINGEAQPLTQSYAYASSEEGEGDKGYTLLTQGGAGDYTVQYKDNVEVGTATVIVKGDGLWAGTLEASFAIEPVPTPANMLTELALSQTSFTYNGAVQIPGIVQVKAGNTEVTPADYSIDFEKADSTEPGTYRVTVKAEEGGDFQGSLTASYTIDPAPLTSVQLNASSATYTGAAHNPVKEVKAGTLKLGAADYAVAYKDASGRSVKSIKNVGTYTVTVTGKGNFAGSKSATFKVTKAENPVTATAKKPGALTFKASAQTIRCPFKVGKAQGAVTYAKILGAKYFTVNKATGKVKVAAKTPVG
jgi:hypothetical protein